MSALGAAYSAYEEGDFTKASSLLSEYETNNAQLSADARHLAHKAIISHPYSPAEVEAALRSVVKAHWGPLRSSSIPQLLRSDPRIACILYNIACCMMQRGDYVGVIELLSHFITTKTNAPLFAPDLGVRIVWLMLMAMTCIGGPVIKEVFPEVIPMMDQYVKAFTASGTDVSNMNDTEFYSCIHKMRIELMTNSSSSTASAIKSFGLKLMGSINLSCFNVSAYWTIVLRIMSMCFSVSLSNFELNGGDVDAAAEFLRTNGAHVISNPQSDPPAEAVVMWARMAYFSNMGCLYYSGKRMAAAAGFFGKALELCDELKVKLESDACKKLRLVIPIMEVLSNAGTAYLRAARPDRARECFTRLSKLRPCDALVWLRLAESHIMLASAVNKVPPKLTYSIRNNASGGSNIILKCPAKVEPRSKIEPIYIQARRYLYRSLEINRIQRNGYQDLIRNGVDKDYISESPQVHESISSQMYKPVSGDVTQASEHTDLSWRNIQQLFADSAKSRSNDPNILSGESSFAARLALSLSAEGAEKCKDMHQSCMIKLAYVNLKLGDFIPALKVMTALLAGECGPRLSPSERALIVIYASEALCCIGEYSLAMDLLDAPFIMVSKESVSSYAFRETLSRLVLNSDGVCSVQKATELRECIVMTNKSLIFALQGKFQAAIDLLSRALEIEPMFQPAITALISIHLRTRDHAAALSMLRSLGSQITGSEADVNK